MKIILLEELENLGKAGTIVEVKDGYARNYLIPKKLAVPATPSNQKQLEQLQKQIAYQKEKARKSRLSLAQKLESTKITLPAKTGKDGKLYGSITSSDIAQAIESQIGEPIDKRKIQLEEPIKQIGIYEVNIKLDQDIHAKIEVEVVPDSKNSP